MFSVGKNLGASLVGTADNCECIPKELMHQQLSFRYLLNDETPFIFLKSAKEDHIFTDRSYIAVRGETAGGHKRIIYRADYHTSPIRDVMFETAGMGITDQDCELKFTIGGQCISVDIRKSEQDTGILYYRALTALMIAQARNAQQLALFQQITARTAIQTAEHNDSAANAASAVAILDQMAPMSYASVFQGYIHK